MQLDSRLSTLTLEAVFPEPAADSAGSQYFRANQEFTVRHKIKDVTAVAVQVIYRLFVTIRMPVKNTAE